MAPCTQQQPRWRLRGGSGGVSGSAATSRVAAAAAPARYSMLLALALMLFAAAAASAARVDPTMLHELRAPAAAEDCTPSQVRITGRGAVRSSSQLLLFTGRQRASERRLPAVAGRGVVCSKHQKPYSLVAAHLWHKQQRSPRSPRAMRPPPEARNAAAAAKNTPSSQPSTPLNLLSFAILPFTPTPPHRNRSTSRCRTTPRACTSRGAPPAPTAAPR